MALALVEVKAAETLLWLKNGQRKRRYAIANAINTVAKAVQAAVKARAGQAFTVRKPDFIMRQVAIIKPFASAAENRLSAKVAVGEKTRLLLSEYEKGGRRRAFVGRRAAVPITGGPARPSTGTSVPQAFTFKGMRLIQTRGGRPVKGRSGRSKRTTKSVSKVAHTTSSGKRQWRGSHRTFILSSTSRAPEGGVYQRVGPGKGDIRMVYSFAGSVPLRPVLRFLLIANAVVRRRMVPALQAEVMSSFKHTLRVR